MLKQDWLMVGKQVTPQTLVVLHIKVYLSLMFPLNQTDFQGCFLSSWDPVFFQFVATPSGKKIAFKDAKERTYRVDTHSQMLLCHRLLSRISHMGPLNCKCLEHVSLCLGKKGKLDTMGTSYLQHKVPELLLQCR